MNEASYSYAYDDIGNRLWSTAGASLSTYAANELNQYATVTNAGAGVPVAYDLDGNMLTNGVWSYTWDAENRMTCAISNNVLIVSNAYDYLNRRIGKTTPSVTRHYIWDGWNIAAEITVDNNADTTNVTRYVWGLDLSGSIKGAGGVGGLISELRDDGSMFFPCYDANGNITDYVDVYGTVRGHFEYDAFGTMVVMSGDLAHTFRFRYSMKYQDDETGNLVYQQRQYIPPLARWASCDPVEEAGGLNRYGFVQNNPITKWDMLGLKWLITRGSQYNWAVAQATTDNDTFQQLADKLRLKYNERTKWLKKSGKNGYVSESDQAKKGCRYGIPNVMAVYTSQSGIGDGFAMFVTELKRVAEQNGDRYQAKGYKVVRKLWQNEGDNFISLWALDGIVAIAFAGHGNKYGFKADTSGLTVHPGEVFPPYKLQGIGAYSCLSDNDIIGNESTPDGTWITHQWKEHLSDNGGSYVGYMGYVNWISVLWDEVSENAGDISE